MTKVYHDEIEIEDFEYEEDEDIYVYPCPCGDQFEITRQELMDGVEEAMCPSCSLVIKVIYDKDMFKAKADEVNPSTLSDSLKKLIIDK